MLLSGVTETLLDSNVVTFVVTSATQILGIMTTPPLGIFLTIGILGSIVGLVFGIVNKVRGR